jgi:hypothetical protein
MAPDGSDAEELPNAILGEHIDAIRLAPSGFGAFGRQLIVARNDGMLFAVDPEHPEPAVFAEAPAIVSDLEFDGGTLYLASYTQGVIRKVDPDGQVTVVMDTPCQGDGLAVAPGRYLFLACGDTNEVYAYSLTSAAWALVTGDAVLNGRWAPSGLLWDGTDTLIVLEEMLETDGSVLKSYGL